MKPLYKTYKHYKGTLYVVYYIGTHTETEEKMVVYAKAFDSSCQIWIRPYDMFFENVIVDGVEMPRFQEVEWEE